MNLNFYDGLFILYFILICTVAYDGYRRLLKTIVKGDAEWETWEAYQARMKSGKSRKLW